MENCVIVNRLLPEDSPKRVGSMPNPKYITIHETELGTEKSPAEYNYEMYQEKLMDTSSSIGYHFMVEANIDDISRVYQFLETDVYSHHTGNAEGNQNSIGIERLVNVNTDMERAIEIQAELTAVLMHKYNISIENVVPHKYWSGKECPARLMAGKYGGWEGFIERVKYHFDKKSEIKDIIFKRAS